MPIDKTSNKIGPSQIGCHKCGESLAQLYAIKTGEETKYICVKCRKINK